MLRLIPLICLAVAVSALAQAPKQASGAASDSIGRGIALAKNGRCPEALPLLRKATLPGAASDEKRQAGFAGVRCAMELDNADSALDFIRMLNRAFPKDPQVLYISVHTYSDLSTKAAQRLAIDAPDSEQALQLNAESLEMQGKWDEAAAEYQKIVQANPRFPGIHFRIGRLLLSRPNPAPSMLEDAKKEFQQELQIDPTNAGAEFVLGELARQQQQWDDAIAHFGRAAKLDPGFSDAYAALGASLLAAKKFPQAIPPLETAAKLEPRNPATHYNLATAYSRSGRKPEADREFAIHKQLLDRQPQPQGQPSPPEPAQ